MFWKNRSKTKLFYKYILSFLIIFLIPYLAISVIFYNMSVSDLREEIILSNTKNLEQVSEFTDLRMRELENIATRISLDHRLTPYMLSQPYNRKQAIEDLSSYKVNSSIIDELYLYYQGEDEIYSSQGTSSTSNFTSRILDISGNKFESANILENTETVIRPLVLPMDIVSNGRQERIISYIYSISPNSAFSYGTVMFFVNEDTLTRLIQNVLGDFDGNIYIFNEEDELLASSRNGSHLDIEDVKGLALSEAGVTDETLNNENYSLVTVRSTVSNWTFVTAMPTDQFYDKMSNLKSTILLIFSIIAILGIGISIFMSFKLYRPIQSLTDFIKNKQLVYTSSKNTNEIENIRKTIELIYDDSEQLQKKMKVHQPFIRDQFLLKLLSGAPTIKEEMKDDYLLKELQITFKGNIFFVVVISFKEKIFEQDSLQNKEIILNLLSKISLQDSHGYCVELIHDNAIGLIVNMKDKPEHAIDGRNKYVSELTYQLQDHMTFISGIGVGEICNGIEKLNRSFIEANAAIEFNLVKNNDEAIYFEDILTHHDEKMIWHPEDNQNQAKFIQSLKQGDQIVAKETLKNILSDLKEKDIPVHIFKCISFDIINSVLRNIPEEGSIHTIDEVKSLVEFQSLEDLERITSSLITKICDEIQNRKASNNLILRDNILGYIQKKYKSHDLSLEDIAEKFHLSTSYLSRFMKEQTGETFTQYVWNLRIREFKRQLLETDLPIKNIVINIGYIDIASFTRKFKKAEGLTPGQYRKFYRLPEDKQVSIK